MTPLLAALPGGWQTLMVPLDVKSNPVMQGITWFATHFIGLFKAGAESFVDLSTGVIPLLLVLITFMNALTTWIGEKRVTRAVQWAGKYAVTRYTIMPMLAAIMLTNPMCYTFGRFLPERYKPAYYDATVSFLHPVTSIFPHANGAELFVWTGVSAGVMKVDGGAYARLAVLYFLVGLIVILMRGLVTQWITTFLIKRGGHTETFKKYDADYAAGRLESAEGAVA
ncbi:PTS glucitol/sorbitol transporter subunit IIC [Acidipropionibacterium virtanenii]|uniref:PTS system glucitol/sorbitol-specific EIIC component n=1 Tax=Acidipropionibacterium virtanenii TaxID=2057246 RepID=A0A344UWJ7_9ACTN|nr:PTS glucitol/sorbitol transporter subunit IIC [Acidipropionibacterium virtanenii]AXE39645.1 PTS system glucitol/sorbitol-specific EIIC component [Acidipropionibacterium virtanenii]